MKFEDDGLDVAELLPKADWDFEPISTEQWQRETEAVVDSYKNEVEHIRVSLRSFARLIRKLNKDVEKLKALYERPEVQYVFPDVEEE